MNQNQTVRTFETGATRDTDSGKLDYEAFLSPIALRRYAEYMHKHRKQADGSLRAGDNWQKGIPVAQYVKSLWRHVVSVWTAHRSGNELTDEQEDNLCAVIFNAFGNLHENLKARAAKKEGEMWRDISLNYFQHIEARTAALLAENKKATA